MPKMLQKWFPGSSNRRESAPSSSSQETPGNIESSEDGQLPVASNEIEHAIEALPDAEAPMHQDEEQSPQQTPQPPRLSPPLTPSPPSSIMSHPVTPNRQAEVLPVTNPNLIAPLTKPGGSPPGEFSTHLRRMTNNLMEIVDQMAQNTTTTIVATKGKELLFVFSMDSLLKQPYNFIQAI